MSLINKNHVSATTTSQTVKWNDSEFVYAKLVNGVFHDKGLIEAVAIDVWMAQHGWEWWEEKARCKLTASISDPCPTQPVGQAKAKQFYTVPVYSHEIGGKRDLIIKGKECTESLSAFFDVIEEVLREAQAANAFVIPVVKLEGQQTAEFSRAPSFTIEDWVVRPKTFPAIIVKL